MKTEEIKDLFAQFESIVCDYNGVECWSARELYKLLGYVQWRNFLAIVDKAKTACENAGMKVADHFADVSKTIAMPKGAERPSRADRTATFGLRASSSQSKTCRDGKDTFWCII